MLKVSRRKSRKEIERACEASSSRSDRAHRWKNGPQHVFADSQIWTRTAARTCWTEKVPATRKRQEHHSRKSRSSQLSVAVISRLFSFSFFQFTSLSRVSRFRSQENALLTGLSSYSAALALFLLTRVRDRVRITNGSISRITLSTNSDFLLRRFLDEEIIKKEINIGYRVPSALHRAFLFSRAHVVRIDTSVVEHTSFDFGISRVACPRAIIPTLGN